MSTKSVCNLFKFKAEGVRAVHEAGHALVGLCLNYKIDKISINPLGGMQGYTAFSACKSENKLDNICVWLAGRAAVESVGVISQGCGYDIEKARVVAAKVDSLNVEKILQEQMTRARFLLEGNCKVLGNIGTALIKYQALSGEDVQDILSGNGAVLEMRYSLEVFRRYKVAKALRVDVSFITAISDFYEGYAVEFKPFFDKQHQIVISSILQQNSIKHAYYADSQCLVIMGESKKQFNLFVGIYN